MLPFAEGGLVMKQSEFKETQIAMRSSKWRRAYRLARWLASMALAGRRYTHGATSTWGLSVSELTRLRQLDQENTKLKQMAAELSFDKVMLLEVSRKKG